MSLLMAILGFLIAIGLLVAVHEYGHFWVARRLGFKVLRFSIGFGRPLLRWHGRDRDRTEYWLSAVPLGGYVKMLDGREAPIPPEDEGRAFNQRPIPARIAVLLAGAGFNFLFAVVAFALMFMVGVPGTQAIIGSVDETSPAEAAGVREQDRIVAVGDRRVTTWEGALLAMLDDMLGEGAVRLTLDSREGGAEREVRLDVAGQERALSEPGALLPGLGLRAWMPPIPPVLDEIVPGAAAEAAGLQPGDELLRVNGEAIRGWGEWVDWVRAHPDERVALEFQRDGQTRETELAIGSVIEDGRVVGRIGAGVSVDHARALAEEVRSMQRYGPLVSLQQGATRTWEMTGLTLRMLGRMVTGDVSVKNISGPINIAQYAGFSLTAGLSTFLNFLAIVSISLGIINLLPIPMLDGGQIVYQLIEWGKGSPLSERTLLICQQTGLVMLAMLMGFAFYQDIMRLLG